MKKSVSGTIPHAAKEIEGLGINQEFGNVNRGKVITGWNVCYLNLLTGLQLVAFFACLRLALNYPGNGWIVLVAVLMSVSLTCLLVLQAIRLRWKR